MFVSATSAVGIHQKSSSASWYMFSPNFGSQPPAQRFSSLIIAGG